MNESCLICIDPRGTYYYQNIGNFDKTLKWEMLNKLICRQLFRKIQMEHQSVRCIRSISHVCVTLWSMMDIILIASIIYALSNSFLSSLFIFQ